MFKQCNKLEGGGKKHNPLIHILPPRSRERAQQCSLSSVCNTTSPVSSARLLLFEDSGCTRASLAFVCPSWARLPFLAEPERRSLTRLRSLSAPGKSRARGGRRQGHPQVSRVRCRSRELGRGSPTRTALRSAARRPFGFARAVCIPDAVRVQTGKACLDPLIHTDYFFFKEEWELPSKSSEQKC